MITDLSIWWHQIKGHHVRFTNIHDVLIGGRAADWLVMRCSCGKTWDT